MACNQVGGLSGAFIPVSEDEGMIAAVQSGHINLEKLEAMTAICSVGLDMIAIPADTPDTTIAAMIADEAAIGVINQKTTAVRIIPYGKEGDMLETWWTSWVCSGNEGQQRLRQLISLPVVVKFQLRFIALKTKRNLV